MITRDKDKAIAEVNRIDGLIEVKPYVKTRSSRQNRALHLFFELLAADLNEFTEFEYKGVTGKTFTTPYTKDIVKAYIWKPLQKVMFNTDSTTKLTTSQINEILAVLAKSFSQFEVVFPSEIKSYIDYAEAH